ncbi:PREDICTED: ribosome production factor 1-like [Acropora digitifera]|uniref:ribosome production factor 1-like n=1 Tax=Acropora digitifera TaxID=70779 RepID=UPI00077AE2ED|nr:PREDICTED: ribosome production factor 1-like [Acropora digitifera]
MASKTRTVALSEIKNKIRRSALYKQEKLRKNKEKRIKNFKRKQQEADGQEEWRSSFSVKSKPYNWIFLLKSLISDGILVTHMPDGPTAHFKLTSVKLGKEIRNHGRNTGHRPELILNNFSTRLGHSVARVLASLFPYDPQFKGRQCVTFHNQRDFIFFRQHRYIFKNAKKTGLQELGPRFTLKLRSLQRGTFDSKYGEYEWIHKVCNYVVRISGICDICTNRCVY